MQKLYNQKDKPKNYVNHFFALQILTIDAQSSTCLSGVCYQLHTYNGSIIHTTSDSRGEAHFYNLSPGNYSLLQSTPSSEYQPHPHCWNILVDHSGCIWIDGIEKNRLIVCNALNSLEYSTDIMYPPVIAQPKDSAYNVCIIDIDITGMQLLEYRVDMVMQGCNMTIHAKKHPGYQLVSPASHTFCHVMQEENWVFQYKKISN